MSCYPFDLLGPLFYSVSVALKPIKIQTFLVQNMLVMLAAAMTLLGLVLSAYNVTFWSGSWGILTLGEMQQHIVLGVVPLANLGYFTSFLFIYLLFEFYGFKHAFYTSFNMGLLILGVYGLFQTLRSLPIDNADVDVYREYRDLLTFSLKDIYSIVAAIMLGHTVTFLLAAMIKKLTHNYLMFLRFIIASLVGFAVFVGVRIFLLYWNVLAPISMLMMAATPMAQFVVGIIAGSVVLYPLRILLGMFRGHERQSAEGPAPSKSKGIFKTASSDLPMDVPATAPALPPIAAAPVAPYMPPVTALPILPVAPLAEQATAPAAVPTQPGPNGGTILFPVSQNSTARS